MVDIGKVKVELKLKKAEAGFHWMCLDKSALKVASAPAPYPTSKQKKTNWDRIAKEEEGKPEGEEALNKLFKDIYANASEETRRAMNKSFQTSGGTVLSTNWSEVGSADYEGKDRPSAPDGQAWKKW